MKLSAIISPWLPAACWCFSLINPQSSHGSSTQPPHPQPQTSHWAFQPILPAPPPILTGSPADNAGWARTPIDAFILSRLRKEGLQPSPEADPHTLARRLSLDLLGLPPSPADIERFLADQAPDAYERFVDRLLASPHFGERWGRHWLDLARYADSDGYEKDSPRPYAYLFRDWVIRAINEDLPFDQFSIEQLAGDLLPGATLSQRIATGFHRNTLTNREGGVDPEEYRCKATVDRVSTTGTVWLGLTIGCAECHSHKYDPISQREFFQLYAFFNNASETDIPAASHAETAAFESRSQEWERQARSQEQTLEEFVRAKLPLRKALWEKTLAETANAGLAENPSSAPRWREDALAAALQNPPGQRAAEQELAVLDYYRERIDPEFQRLTKEISEHQKKKPQSPPAKAAVLAEEQPARVTRIHLRGDFLRPGELVSPGTPGVLHPLKTPPGQQRITRLDLAQWLFDPANPLTPRVAVNQVWHHLFGRGLVAEMGDWGLRGEPPSHPELLDWLAAEWPRLGWSRKALIRLIVTSAAYRQSSKARPELEDRDPNNAWLARQNRFRMEAEIVRDQALAVSGLLSVAIGGPSVRPPLAADIAAVGFANSVNWIPSRGADQFRRGLYIFFQRTVPFPMLTTFDTPDSNAACVRRERSNTPLQALTLLNDPVFFSCAQALGQQTIRQTAGDADRIRAIVERCLARDPGPQEMERLLQLYQQYRKVLESKPAEAAALAGHPENATSSYSLATAALVGITRAIMNLDEFITRE